MRPKVPKIGTRYYPKSNPYLGGAAYIPFSSPFYQLELILSSQVTKGRALNLPMDSTILDELPMLDPESDPVVQNPCPNPPAKGTWPMGKRTDRLPGQRPKYATPTKFANARPDPLYYFEDGLRRVHPYYFTFNTFCKNRWIGRTLLEVFTTEFRDRTVEYYVSCFLRDA